jgi:DNA-binding response OmpR family regulator
MKAKTILIVDDDQAALDALSQLVKSAGYECLTATDGATAVSIARQEQPELMLLDLLYPPDVAHGGGINWDGFLLMDWMRRMCGAGRTPMFIVTVAEAAEYKNRALAKGAAAFFQKPVNGDELVAAIRATIGEGSVPAPEVAPVSAPAEPAEPAGPPVSIHLRRG